MDSQIHRRHKPQSSSEGFTCEVRRCKSAGNPLSQPHLIERIRPAGQRRERLAYDRDGADAAYVPYAVPCQWMLTTDSSGLKPFARTPFIPLSQYPARNAPGGNPSSEPGSHGMRLVYQFLRRGGGFKYAGTL